MSKKSQLCRTSFYVVKYMLIMTALQPYWSSRDQIYSPIWNKKGKNIGNNHFHDTGHQVMKAKMIPKR